MVLHSPIFYSKMVRLLFIAHWVIPICNNPPPVVAPLQMAEAITGAFSGNFHYLTHRLHPSWEKIILPVLRAFYLINNSLLYGMPTPK